MCAGITASLEEDRKTQLLARCEEVVKRLKAKGVQAQSDTRDNYSPGWKFNHWELKVRSLSLMIYSFHVNHSK